MLRSTLLPRVARGYLKRFFSTKKDPYELLGVSRTATGREIKQAFYKLSKRYHPDVPGSDSAKFLEIREAYDTLRDPEKRRMYDMGFGQQQHHGYQGFQYGAQQGPFGYRVNRNIRPEDFEQIMREMDRMFKNFGNTQNTKNTRFWGFRREFNQEEFDKIWREMRNNAAGRSTPNMEDLFRRARDRAEQEYTARAGQRWQGYQEERHEKEPWNDPSFKMGNYIDMNKYKKLLIAWFWAAVTIAFVVYTVDPFNRGKTQQLFDPNVDSQGSIRRMMETPPMNPPTNSEPIRESPIRTEDPIYPMGFPPSAQQ